MIKKKINLKKQPPCINNYAIREKAAKKIYTFMINNKLKAMGNSSFSGLSINVTEWYTNTLVKNISPVWIFCLEDSGEVYTFDVRSLYNLKKFINPYTNHILHESIHVLLHKKIQLLERLGFDMNITSLPQLMITNNDIIYKLHSLDYDINPKWITDMSVAMCRKLYLSCYTEYKKLNYTLKKGINCILFYEFKKTKDFKKYLETEVINTNSVFNLLKIYISSCKNIEYQKLGAMYFLKSLALCSSEVESAFSYLLY